MDLEQSLDGLLLEFMVKLGVKCPSEVVEDLKWKIIGMYSASTVNLGDLSQWLPAVALSTTMKKES